MFPLLVPEVASRGAQRHFSEAIELLSGAEEQLFLTGNAGRHEICDFAGVLCLAWRCEASGMDGFVSSRRQVGVGSHKREPLVVEKRTRVRTDGPFTKLT